MSELMEKVSQAGFDTRTFFYHSTSVGYLAQLLRLNLETPSPREKEILHSLRLPNYVATALARPSATGSASRSPRNSTHSPRVSFTTLGKC